MRLLPIAAAAALLMLQPVPAAAADPGIDRFEIVELMNRYGAVHDFGTADEYADLFTPNGEIAAGGGPTLVKGRDAIRAFAERDRKRFAGKKTADGKDASIMRHVISNPVAKLTGAATATGSCYVLTIVQNEGAPAILSISRYEDEYAKTGGEWRIAKRRIVTDFGDSALAKKLGFF